ncbi:uncharacterized protein [Amphiura filiformis]|uniref:uncharacterized protein n=1 Tax=Amphiura filiformis TaxID=82378 RepID=UPI003B2205F5
MDQNITEDYSESGGFPEFSFVSTSEEAHNVIDEYEIRTTSRFSCYVAQKGFGCTDFYDESRKLKVLWEDFQDNNTTSGMKAWRLEFDGVPYLSLSWKKFDCHHGLDRKVPHKEKRRKSEGSEGKKRGQGTKKLGCPAKVILREVVKFPEFMISQDTHWYRHEASRKIRAAIKSKKPVGERRIYIYLPKISDHRQHLTGAAGGITQRLDSRIKFKIQQLNAEGQSNVDDIRRELHHYVENELFIGSEPPPLTSRRFYPTKTDIRNHLYLARTKQEKFNTLTAGNSRTDVTCSKSGPSTPRIGRSPKKRKLKETTDSDVSENTTFLPTDQSSAVPLLVHCPDHVTEVEISSQEVIDASNSIQAVADSTVYISNTVPQTTFVVVPETEHDTDGHSASTSNVNRTTENETVEPDMQIQIIPETGTELSHESRQGQNQSPVEQHNEVNDSTVIDNLNLITQAMEARMLESSQVLSSNKSEPSSSSDSTVDEVAIVTERTISNKGSKDKTVPVRAQCRSLLGRVKHLTGLVQDVSVLETVQNKLLDLVSDMELHVSRSSEQNTSSKEHIVVEQVVVDQNVEGTPEVVESVKFEIVL